MTNGVSEKYGNDAYIYTFFHSRDIPFELINVQVTHECTSDSGRERTFSWGLIFMFNDLPGPLNDFIND